MRYLLDTCTFLWLTTKPTELSVRAAATFVEPANEIYLSVVSSWEIAVKWAAGRLPLPEPVEIFIPTERSQRKIASLALVEEATLLAGKLAPYHQDPFDRLLVCQADLAGMTILTPDPFIRRYGIPTLW